MIMRSRKPLLCRLNVRHKWHTESTDDGGRYLRCQRCGKDETGPVGDGSNKGFISAHAAGVGGRLH